MNEKLQIFLSEKEMNEIEMNRLKDSMLKSLVEKTALEIQNRKMNIQLIERDIKTLTDVLKQQSDEVNSGRKRNLDFMLSIKKKYNIKPDADLGITPDGELLPPEGILEDYLIDEYPDDDVVLVPKTKRKTKLTPQNYEE